MDKKKIAIVTDSNSGILSDELKERLKTEDKIQQYLKDHLITDLQTIIRKHQVSH